MGWQALNTLPFKEREKVIKEFFDPFSQGFFFFSKLNRSDTFLFLTIFILHFNKLINTSLWLTSNQYLTLEKNPTYLKGKNLLEPGLRRRLFFTVSGWFQNRLPPPAHFFRLPPPASGSFFFVSSLRLLQYFFLLPPPPLASQKKAKNLPFNSWLFAFCLNFCPHYGVKC